jgi:hypothetical protein
MIIFIEVSVFIKRNLPTTLWGSLGRLVGASLGEVLDQGK